jgi:hypothetical protein
MLGGVFLTFIITSVCISKAVMHLYYAMKLQNVDYVNPYLLCCTLPVAIRVWCCRLKCGRVSLEEELV